MSCDVTMPERVLWVLWKRGRYTCARVRMTALGPELRLFQWRASKTRDDNDLLHSSIFREQDGGSRALGEFAEMKRQKLLSLGWEMDHEAMASHVEPYDSVTEH